MQRAQYVCVLLFWFDVKVMKWSSVAQEYVNASFPRNYRVVLAHRIWQIETAVWNLAGFLHCAWVRGKWRGFRPGSAACKSPLARVHTDI